MLQSRRSITLCVLLGALVLGWLAWRETSSSANHEETSGVTVTKQAVNFVNRTFDPASPPPDMPPLNGAENAECDSEFLSDASVGGDTARIDSTHANLTITHVKITLQLNITIWVPAGVTSHVAEHEDGHRQISEYYYQNAEKIAGQIAATYLGKQVGISGADLNAESSKLLRQMAAEVTAEYNRELDPGPTQLLYDEITDHSRNGVVARDAVSHAIKNIRIESPSSGKS